MDESVASRSVISRAVCSACVRSGVKVALFQTTQQINKQTIPLKIFISIPWFIPAYLAGGPVRSIAHLVKEYPGPEYYIFCSDTDINGEALENVATGKWNHFAEGVQVWYAERGKVSHNITRQIDKIEPDILFMIGLYSWHYTLVPLIFSKAHRKIISVRGMLHPGALTLKKWKKRFFLRLFRLFEYPHRIAFHATDEEEKHYILACFGDVAKAYVAGNFSDFKGMKHLPPKSKGALKMLSIGLISPMKNIHMVLEALRNISGQIEYEIAGPIIDDDYWVSCRELIRQLPENIAVHYRGHVPPEDVGGLLEKSHIFILPSKSENFGHAIFEALSSGRPVVTSQSTPWNNLKDACAGINVFPTDTNDLTSAIELFANMEAQELEAWSMGALKYAQERYHPEQIREAYKRMFEDEIGNN